MPDSPQRLLQGIAVALTEEVAPHVDDPFARMQCKAAAELLANLADELDWAQAPLQRRNDELRAILDALRRSGWSGPGPSGADGRPAAREAGAEATRAELREAMRWLAGQAPEAAVEVDELLRSDLENQVAKLRRGMFR